MEKCYHFRNRHLNQRITLEQAELRKRIFNIERLASMPQVVWRLVEALGDENSDASKLAEIIESDPALTSKVLNLANSAYFGFSQEVTTIRRAVVAIGFKELQLLALGSGLADVFDPQKAPAGFDGEGLWLHCMGVAWASRELAEKLNHPSPGEVMISGLLHDLGKLVLAGYLRDEFRELLALANEGRPWFKAENELGTPHSLVGWMLAERWELPQVHKDVIRYHHHSRISGANAQSVGLVALGDALTKALGFGLVQESAEMDRKRLLDQVGLPLEAFKAVAVNARDRFGEMAESWRSAGRTG